MIPIGLASNLIHLAFYCRKKYINKTMNAYYIIISINNIIALLLTSLYFIDQLDQYNFDKNLLLGCRLTQFTIRVSYATVSWLNYLITLDRLIYILFNHRYNMLVNKYSVSEAILLMYGFLILANSPNFWFKGIVFVENSSNNATVILCFATQQVVYVREFLAQIVGIYLPIFLMVSTNALLIYKVWHLKKKLNKLKDFKFLFSLILSNIIFILGLLPLSILLIFYLIFMMYPAVKLQFPFFDRYSRLFDNVARITSCFNFSLGIFFPILINPVLRQEFLNMFTEIGYFFKKIFRLSVKSEFGSFSK